MECKICLHSYNQSAKRPRNLPCGHTFCGRCLEGLLSGGSLRCPSCRGEHRASRTSEFPFAFELEEMVSRIREISFSGVPLEEDGDKEKEGEMSGSIEGVSKLKGKSFSEAPEEDEDEMDEGERMEKVSFSEASGKIEGLRTKGASFSEVPEEDEGERSGCKEGVARPMGRSLSSLKEAQRHSAAINTRDCEKMLCKLESHSKSIDKMLSTEQERIDVFIERNKQLQIYSAQQKEQISLLRNKGWECKEHLQGILRSLDAAISWQDVGSVADKADERSDEFQEWMKDCCHFSHRFVKNSFSYVSTDEMTSKWGFQPHQLNKSPSNAELGEKATQTLERRLRQLVKSRKMVVAIQYIGHGFRYARISVDEGTTCLHHLQNEVPADGNIYRIAHEDVMYPLEMTSALTFLDLCWPASPPRRVYIQLDPEGNRALGNQFLAMCTAQRGPTYAHTYFERVFDREGEHECLEGGNYDRMGGTVIMDGIGGDGGVMTTGEEGLVGGLYNAKTGYRNTMFRITTKRSKGHFSNHFGKVVRGMDMVKEAARSLDARSVFIVDCGVVVLR